jgi:hypothetical protein
MSTDFDELLADVGGPGLPELRCALQELAARAGAIRRRPASSQLKPGIHRVVVETDGGVQSYIVKLLAPDIGHRNRMVLSRWLPAASLQHLGPALLATAADRQGTVVWHVYEDLGERALDANKPDRQRVQAAVDAIVELHARFAGHALLGECRLWGGDLGGAFFAANVRDAIAALQALRVPAGDCAALRERLLRHLLRLHGERTARLQQLEALGGPETLLHGDLWPQNIIAHGADGQLAARLIDWDRAGVGPVTYDLSAFLLRFPGAARAWILALYRERIGRHGLVLPPDAELNLLFDTAEQARIANRVIWLALAASQERPDAAACLLELAEVERWFEQLAPVLPAAGAKARGRAS